jgi:hypothetical protein
MHFKLLIPLVIVRFFNSLNKLTLFCNAFEGIEDVNEIITCYFACQEFVCVFKFSCTTERDIPEGKYYLDDSVALWAILRQWKCMCVKDMFKNK